MARAAATTVRETSRLPLERATTEDGTGSPPGPTPKYTTVETYVGFLHQILKSPS